jgi:L-ascorbate metabolism protein UlaG (beta-lactamase superfamily)
LSEKEKIEMKRRKLIRYAGASMLAAVGNIVASGLQTYQAQTKGSVSVQWLGHTCFLFTGSGLKILVNPFQAIGCTKGYRLPKINADLVLISSQLLDEGAVGVLPGKPRILFEPGVYEMKGTRIQGISIPHDREGGRRFGTNVAWQWSQGGIRILHLGGAAGPIEIEQKILMGAPDVVLIPVGGGIKAYTPQEAKQAIEVLNPKIVIPTHYLTNAADKNVCDLAPVDEFLKLADKMPVSRTNSNTIALTPSNIPKQGTAIKVMSY